MTGETLRSARPATGQHLRAVVRDSPVPVLLIRLADGRSLEASDSFLAFTGRDRATVLGMRVATRSMALVASGALDGYTRHASFRRPDGELVECDLRVTACTEENRQHAVVSVLPTGWPRGGVGQADGGPGGGLVMGTVDGQWRVDRIASDDDGELLFSPADLVGRSLFVLLHPEDVGEVMFLAAHASRHHGSAFGRIRLKARGGGWVPRRVAMQALVADSPAGYAFSVWTDAPVPRVTEASDVESVLETTMANIRASTIASWMVKFPTSLQLPELNELTAREYEILIRLATGERVQLIADELHLSQSTVRNHLTSIFRKTGVGTQNELLALLRRRGAEVGV